MPRYVSCAMNDAPDPSDVPEPANPSEKGSNTFGGVFQPIGVHPLRPQLTGEVHARPFLLLKTPARIAHFAFMTDEEAAARDRRDFCDLCRSHGIDPPLEAKFASLDLGKARLRWEQHSEFTTYTFDTGHDAAVPFKHATFDDVLPGWALKPPGPLIVQVNVALVKAAKGEARLRRLFDPASLSLSEVEEGDALIATDFKSDASGAGRILIEDRGLDPARAGALAQRLLEIETYRVLTLLGLPEALKQGPATKRIETALGEIMATMRSSESLQANRELLDRLMVLGSDLEAQSAASSFRFGASRAYAEIVQARLRVIGERSPRGSQTWEAFLLRRLGPAIQTCTSVEQRQRDLSKKLSRAANLLRTRVDIQVEQQNRDLLQSMNRRARMQLRLQRTVEGLSVAAVSYYVVGLLGYLFKGAKDAGFPVPVTVATALTVPVVVLAIWGLLRRIRKVHKDPG